jgi:glycosyltransferase involved in cell wall biosynthesis
MSEDIDVAVVHGNYLTHGGGEVVAEQLAKTFDAPLYYGFGDTDAVPANDVDHHSLFNDSILSRGKSSPAFRDLYYMWNWQHVPELHDYDVLIQSGNEMGWYVPPDEQVIIKYVHSTPRAAYDRFPNKGDNTLTRLASIATRVLYQPNIPFPDIYVANSELIQRRINRYWGVDDVNVVYPPIDVDSYKSKKSEDFYFTFSRLVPSKGIDEIVKAFNEYPDKSLLVGGTGPQEDELRNIAEDNIEFLGFISEDRKRELLGSAKAFIFAAQNEDFGIVPVEALASGTPVIGVREGYTKYQISDGENGVLFDRGVDELRGAIGTFEKQGVEMDNDDISSSSNKYSVEQFESQMKEIVEKAKNSAGIEQKNSEY